MDEELHLGGDVAADDDLAVVLTSGGLAVLAPRSIRALRGDALEAVADLQHTVAEMERLRGQAYSLAYELRVHHGASWSAIAWCMGLSESRARQIVAEYQEKNDA